MATNGDEQENIFVTSIIIKFSKKKNPLFLLNQFHWLALQKINYHSWRLHETLLFEQKNIYL